MKASAPVAAQLPATGPYASFSATGSDLTPLEPGGRIGKYRLVFPIGEGGMSVVYLAHDEALDRRVAVKVLHRHLARDPEARARFSREARAVARLTHRNIPEIYDFSEAQSDGPSFIVTEYVDGPPLSTLLRDDGGLLPEHGVMLSLGVARALVHAHAHSVVHRDVKPENVLVGKDGVVKLTDFGIAQIRGLESMTMTGTLIGSPAHMAPEQIEIAKDVDARADVWGLGTVLYMAVTGGKLPFEADNPHRLLKQIVDGHYVDPRRLSPHVDSRLAGIVRRCLVVDRAARYQSVQDVARDLEAWLAERELTDVEKELRALVADPAAERARLSTRLVGVLVHLGDAAAAKKDRSAALEHFGRVLVLDPDHADALARVRKLEKQLRTRRGLRLALVAAASLAALAAVGWLGLALFRTSPIVQLDARGLARTVPPAPPTLAPTPPLRAGLDVGDALALELVRFDARLALAPEPNLAEIVKPPPADTDVLRPRDDDRDRRPKPTPVAVRLTVYPPAVRIAVDGRALAPGERTELMPGAYRVTLTHTGCPRCAPDTRTLLVPNPPPGEERRLEQHYVFERSADAFEPATLQVRCSDGSYVTDEVGRRYDCNVVHALPVVSATPVTIMLTAHDKDGARLRQQKFTLQSKRPIVWQL